MPPTHIPEPSETAARYDLVLYVAGNSPNSARARINLQQLCQTHLLGRHVTTIVDVLADPLSAVAGGIFVTPTLVKRGPGEVRFIIGDLSRRAELLAALELATATASPTPA